MKTSSELVYPAVHPEDAVLLQKYAGMCLLGKFNYGLNRNSSPHWGGRRARDQLTAEKIFPLQSTVQVRNPGQRGRGKHLGRAPESSCALRPKLYNPLCLGAPFATRDRLCSLHRRVLANLTSRGFFWLVAYHHQQPAQSAGGF